MFNFSGVASELRLRSFSDVVKNIGKPEIVGKLLYMLLLFIVIDDYCGMRNVGMSAARGAHAPAGALQACL